LKLHLLPSDFLNLEEREKAFVIAAIQIKAKKDKKEADKLKSKVR